MSDLSDDKFMLLYNEIKAVRQELTTLKDERLQRMTEDVAALKVRMVIVYGILGLIVAGVVAQFFK